MSDTPKTDAKAFAFTGAHGDTGFDEPPKNLVTASFARELEREINQLREELAEAKKEAATTRPILDDLRWHANAICAITGRCEHDLTGIVSDIIKERAAWKAVAGDLGYHVERAQNEACYSGGVGALAAYNALKEGK